MTAAELQRDLVEEMKKLFRGITTENTSGETVTGLNVYEQNLPVVTDDEEDESQFFPYALVKLETGKTADDDSPWVSQQRFTSGYAITQRRISVTDTS